jgi:hypothetical protein
MLMAASGSGEFLAPNASPDWCAYTEESHPQSSFPHFPPTEVTNNFSRLPNESESESESCFNLSLTQRDPLSVNDWDSFGKSGDFSPVSPGGMYSL